MAELNRFDKNARRNMQIRTKLLAVIGLAVTLSCVSIAFITMFSFSKKYESISQKTLRNSVKGLAVTVANWEQSAISIGKNNYDRQELIDALSRKDRNSLSKFVNDRGGIIDAHFFGITDEKGRILCGKGFSDGEDLSASVTVREALAGKKDTYTYVTLKASQFAVIAATPVLEGEKVIGTLVVGYDNCGEEFEEIVTESFGCEYSFLKGDLRVKTSLTDENGKSLEGTRLESKTVIESVYTNKQSIGGKIVIAGKKYQALYLAVLDSTEEPCGCLFIGYDTDNIMNFIKSTWTQVIPSIIILVIIITVSCFFFVRWLMWRIANVTKFLEEMETGDADLTKRVKLLIRDEIGDLVIHFDAFCDKLQEIVTEIKESKNELSTAGEDLSATTLDTTSAITQIIANIDSVHSQISNQNNSVRQTADAVDEISQTINTIDSMIENQSAGVTQASAAVEQMIGNISSVNSSVDKMASSFESLSENAQTGFSKQQDVNERILQIEMQSEMLQEANFAISSIAEQTNLLAMNAAIEAAHAGEAGKGFSVVADEIRKLSETSSSQSKTIGEQLNKIKDSISEVVSASNESSAAFTAVSEQIKETDELVIQIKAAMDEQNSGSKQIGDALRSMNDSTVEVRQASKEMSSQNERILSEIHSLKDTTENMINSMDEMSDGARKINETGSALNGITHKVQETISTIGEQIDKFKV